MSNFDMIDTLYRYTDYTHHGFNPIVSRSEGGCQKWWRLKHKEAQNERRNKSCCC